MNRIACFSLCLVLALLACQTGQENPLTSSKSAEDSVQSRRTLGLPGSACYQDSDCPGGICWQAKAGGYPGGYCVIEHCRAGDCPAGSECRSFGDGVKRCVDVCQQDSDCRVAEGYVCDDWSTCWPGTETVALGGSCGYDWHCAGGDQAQCLHAPGFVGGACLLPGCRTDDDCPAASVCRPIPEDDSACVQACERDADCRKGYGCVQGGCLPACAADDDCPGDTVCQEAICKAKPVAGDPLEPNDSQAQATDLTPDGFSDLKIGPDDQDWFRWLPEESGQLITVAIEHQPAHGDLELALVDGQGNMQPRSGISASDYHTQGSVGPIGKEAYSFVGVPEAQPFWLRVSGHAGATNAYQLTVESRPFEDGPDCLSLYDQSECWALDSEGRFDAGKLMLFPGARAADPAIGAGVQFKNGLVFFGNDPLIRTSFQWGRREIIMILRHAIRSVQEAFPDTAPLGIGDIGMPDGTTPAGHPWGTHHYGANVDIAYYIQPEFQREHGNMVFRQICCDETSMTAWSCVDFQNNASPDYGTCKPGSEDTHIVDLPRTAMLLAKIAGSGRLRVVGVEAKIVSQLEATLDTLAETGLITPTERDQTKAHMASALDHGSWIWHFHHMHVSFLTGPAERRDFEGPWLEGTPEEQTQWMRTFRENAR